MENHFHLLLMTLASNLNSFMQRLNTTYIVYYNRRHRRTGHLFQGRYKAIVVDSDSYLIELSRYIHLNPVRTKRYSQFEINEKKQIIRRYPWSSYCGYVSLKQRHSFVFHDKILTMVGNTDDRNGRKRYEQFVVCLLYTSPSPRDRS